MNSVHAAPSDPPTRFRPVLYTGTGCPGSDGARAVLERQGIDYDERNVTADPALSAEMRRLSGQAQTPVVVWADEVFADTGAAEFESFLAALVFSGKVRL